MIKPRRKQPVTNCKKEVVEKTVYSGLDILGTCDFDIYQLPPGREFLNQGFLRLFSSDTHRGSNLPICERLGFLQQSSLS